MKPFLTVTTPAADRNLSTPEKFQQLTRCEADIAAAIEPHLAEASQSIALHLGALAGQDGSASLISEVVSETRFDIDRLPLTLGRWPVTAVASIVEDGLTLQASDYLIDAFAARIYRLDSGGARRAWRANKVTVDYTAGFLRATDDAAGTLPAPIEHACIFLAARLFSLAEGVAEDPAPIKQESFPGIGSWTFALESVSWENGVSSDVRAKLAKYKRPRLGQQDQLR